VRYYFSVFYVLFQNSISRELQFNFNFVLQFIGNILWLLFSLLFFYIVYQHTNSINGWSIHQTFFLVNLNQFIIYIYQMFFARNINQLSEIVRMGTLDNYIIKPIDLQFLISFRYIDLRPLFMLPLPLFIMMYIIKTNGYNFSFMDFILSIVAIIMAIIIRYSIGFIIGSFAFLFTRIYALNALQNEFLKYAGYPASIFRGVKEKIFTFIIPVILIANLPASFVLKLLENKEVLLLYSFFYSIFLFFLSRLIFYKMLEKYTSASS